MDDAATGLPLATIVEYDAPALTRDEAGRMARQARSILAAVDGLLAARFWGDFETGRHCYQLVWRDRAALDAYLASDEMLRVRLTVADRVVGRPERRIVTDYTDDGGNGR